MNIFIGRQPIFNRYQEVSGYELLYSEPGVAAGNGASDRATLTVILNTFLNIGTANLLNDKPAHVNLTRNFILGGYPLPFPPGQTVIEVSEDIQVDPPLIAALTDLVQKGYLIALDVYTHLDRMLPLLPLAHMVKLETRVIPAAQLPLIVKGLHRQNLKLLAQKVETQDEFRKCMDLGFDYFQGYFFSKPNLIQQRQLETSRLVVMQALARLSDPNVDFAKLESIVKVDVSLSYKLLRLVNSGYYGLPTTVGSLRQAFTILGLNQMRGWMTLLLMSRLQNKPHELATVALVRARMSELIARATNRKPFDGFFLTGLFSVMDAYLDKPISEAIADMPISPQIYRALTSFEGAEGSVLKAVESFELGNWQPTQDLGLVPEQMNHIFADAVAYASDLSKHIES